MLPCAAARVVRPPPSAAGLLLLLGVIVVLFNEHAYKDQKQRELGVQAQIISASVAPALIFLDDASAQQYLTALAANPSIAAAGVYDASGAQVARYARTGDEAPPPLTEVRRPRFEGAFDCRRHAGRTER